MLDLSHYGQIKEGEKPISIGSTSLGPKEPDRGYKMRGIDGRFRFRMKDQIELFERVCLLGGAEARGGRRPKVTHGVAGRSGGRAAALARR